MIKKEALPKTMTGENEIANPEHQLQLKCKERFYVFF